MPCMSYEPEDHNDSLHTKLKWAEAALCLVISNWRKDPYGRSFSDLLDILFRDSDWKEAGITRESLIEWEEKHVKADIRRRALEKLTDEEKKVLGL